MGFLKRSVVEGRQDAVILSCEHHGRFVQTGVRAPSAALHDLGGMNSSACVPAARIRRGLHPSHSVKNTALLGGPATAHNSLHISPRGRYNFKCGCIAETRRVHGMH